MMDDYFGAGDMSAIEAAAILAGRDDDREALREQRERDERAALREERTAVFAFADRAAGSPLAGMQAARSALEAAGDECRDLAEKLRKAEARRDRAQSNLEFFAERMQQATELVSRSAPDELDAAKVARETLNRLRVEARLAGHRELPPSLRRSG